MIAITIFIALTIGLVIGAHYSQPLCRWLEDLGQVIIYGLMDIALRIRR